MHLKSGRQFLMEDRGMLRWAELDARTGYRTSSAFILEKVCLGESASRFSYPTTDPNPLPTCT